jgi:hypothetical protein
MAIASEEVFLKPANELYSSPVVSLTCTLYLYSACLNAATDASGVTGVV